MASKSKRATTSTPQPGSSTPLLPGSKRPESPLSPTRRSRIEEKKELQGLNDRLAAYIDRVRFLETENSRLVVEVQSIRENINRESSNVKSMYETELNDARRLLDETAREKAKLEIDIKRLWEENDELKAKLDKKTKESNIHEGNARMYESRAADLSNKYTQANADRKKATDELKEKDKELDRLRKLLDETRKNLEDETLARVDLENTIQSLREELSFKDQIHMQEVNETRSRRQVEISEIDGRLSEQYEAKLQQSLQELRDRYEAQMRNNREEIEALYESKIRSLQDAASRATSNSSHMNEELRTTRSRIDGLNSRIGELENTNAALNARIKDLEILLDNERARHNLQLKSLEDEISRLREEQQQMMKDYQDLMETKVSLDLELAAYDKLLHGEETRLNITPTNLQTSSSSFSQSVRSSRATPSRKTPTRGGSIAGVKRKRTVIDETEDISQSEFFVTGSAKGDIEIAEVDAEGKFVKLHNKGSKEIAIGGWQLSRSVNGNQTTFKFHRSVKIDAGAIVTVWSEGAGVQHDPPANIVMKTQRWFVGDNMKTSLFNSEGEEVAGSERVKRTMVTHSARHRTTGRGGFSTIDGEDLHHEQEEPKEGDEKCRIM